MTTAAAKPTTAALTWARNCRQLSEKRLTKGMLEVAPPKKKIFLQKRQLPHWGVVVGLSRNQRKKVQFGSCQEVATEVISILPTLKLKVNKNYLFYPPLSDVSRRVYWNLTQKVLPTLKSVIHQECVVLYGGIHIIQSLNQNNKIGPFWAVWQLTIFTNSFILPSIPV